MPSDGQSELFDDDAEGDGKYFKFYMPGVGTPFPEVNDPDYSTMGLVGAVKGEDRINWALLRIIDVLMFSATKKMADHHRESSFTERNEHQLEPAVVWRQP